MSVRLSRRSRWVAAIICATVAAVYLSLAAYQQVDAYLFPANELTLPAISVSIPATDIGVDVSLPGVATTRREPWRPSDRINILFLGLDRRPNEPEDASFRSDTMFVASIDSHARRMQMLAIPRDFWADIPFGNKPGDWAQNKINAAYGYGQFYKYPGGGSAAAVAAVEKNFNIDIHHFVVVDWVGFVELIDAIGGIDIVVPADISDFGTDVLDLFPDQTVKAGPQHMDGARALGYSRVRTDGDLKRIERQQLVIQAVANKSVDLGYVTKVPELWDAYKHAFRTDIDNAVIPGFALLAKQLNLTTIESFSMAPAMYGGISEDGQLILLADQDKLYDIIDRFFADPEMRAENPVVVIEYPAGQEPAAQAAQKHLLEYGMPGEFVRLAKSDRGGDQGIFDLSGKVYTTEKLSDLFDLKVLVPAGEMTAGADIVVRIDAATKFKNP